MRRKKTKKIETKIWKTTNRKLAYFGINPQISIGRLIVMSGWGF